MPRIRITSICALLGGSLAFGQADWTTAGFDAQRSYWLRNDAKISLESMKEPGFSFLWKGRINPPGRPTAAVTPPALIDFYIGYRGFRALGFMGSGANAVTVFDTDLGRTEWTKEFKVPPAQATPGCPGGMTANVARTTGYAYPTSVVARGFGRGTPAKSDVGAPGEGATILRDIANRPPRQFTRPTPAPSKRRAGAETDNSPFSPRVQWLYALASDGKLHSMYISNGEEPKDPATFLPANAHTKGLMVVDGVAYVTTTNSCGGVDNGLWTLNLPTSKVTSWKAPAPIAGTNGFAMGPDATLYTAAGNELVALEDETLRVKGAYRIGSAKFSSSPVVFEYKGKDMVAATSDDGRLHLVDPANMERAVATTPAFSAPGFQTGAIASWRDAAGVRWLLVPASGALPVKAGFRGSVTNGAIAAWKIVERNGAPTLQPGWLSRDMVSPITPIVVNGVVFAVASGAKTKTPAVLYALDSATGQALWNSGKTLPSWVTTGSLAAGGSRVYVATHDGTQYVFGIGIEH